MESAAERIVAEKTYGAGDTVDIAGAGGQAVAGFVQTQKFDILGWVGAKGGFEPAVELAWAEAGAGRKVFHAEICVKIGQYPGCKIGTTIAGLGLELQRFGTLQLPNGVFQIHHEMVGKRAVISAQKRQCVVARRPSTRPVGARPYRPVQTETMRRNVGAWAAIVAAMASAAPARR